MYQVALGRTHGKQRFALRLIHRGGIILMLYHWWHGVLAEDLGCLNRQTTPAYEQCLHARVYHTWYDHLSLGKAFKTRKRNIHRASAQAHLWTQTTGAR